jgi:hypothetical protein
MTRKSPSSNLKAKPKSSKNTNQNLTSYSTKSLCPKRSVKKHLITKSPTRLKEPTVEKGKWKAKRVEAPEEPNEVEEASTKRGKTNAKRRQNALNHQNTSRQKNLR